MESDLIFATNTQNKISAAEHAFSSEMAITQVSLTASATSKRCGGYREPNDTILTSQEFVTQTPVAKSVSKKSLSPTNGNLMFLDAVEIEPQIQFSGLEREATRMVRSPKAEMLFQISLNYFILNRFC